LTANDAQAEVKSMGDPEDGTAETDMRSDLMAEMQRNAIASIEANPWIPVFRLVRDEADRSGHRYLIEMFVSLFKAYESSRYPPG
jgi:hypothetical protein